jgi:hypothetical protein
MAERNERRDERESETPETESCRSDSETDGLITDGGQSGDLTDCTAYQRDCLTAVHAVESLSAAASGRDVRDWLEDSPRYDEVDHDRLSRDLDALVDDGYVEKGVADCRTYTYRTTELGDRVLVQRQTDTESEAAGSETDHGTAVADD